MFHIFKLTVITLAYGKFKNGFTVFNIDTACMLTSA